MCRDFLLLFINTIDIINIINIRLITTPLNTLIPMINPVSVLTLLDTVFDSVTIIDLDSVSDSDIDPDPDIDCVSVILDDIIDTVDLIFRSNNYLILNDNN